MVMLPTPHITTSDPVPFSLGSVDEEGENVLDCNILDDASDSIDSMAAASYGQQQEHFTTDHAFVAPAQSEWPQFTPNHDAMESMTFTTVKNPQNFFPKQVDGNYNSQTNAPQSADYANHTQSWPQPPFLLGSDQQSASYSTYLPETPIKGEALPNSAVAQTSQTTSPEYQPYPTSATSPRSDAGWMSNSSSDPVDSKSKREMLSPLFDYNPLHIRRDGIRKKNARFAIPDDRRVDTIDKIIASTDPREENLLKELKAQKRLLRNRQAALDSRSRKKEHTQRLEEQHKLLTQHMEAMEDELHQRRMQEARWLQERNQWQNMVNGLYQEKEMLLHERDEIVQRHTLETAALRRKTAFLMEEAHRQSTVPMSDGTSSAGFSNGFPDFDHLPMQDGFHWDEFSLVPTANGEHDVPRQEAALAIRAKDGKGAAKDEDKSAASGLLLMLLLCGAWVASRGPIMNSAIPSMPEDVRVASAAVLDNIYQDAGLQPQRTVPPTNPSMARPTSYQHPQNPAYPPPSDPFTLHQQLANPTPAQRRDELFSLSSTQYNAITTDPTFFDLSQSSPGGKRRSLQDSLAAMRVTKPGPAGEIYTKSLMMGEVPANVVRDFARMVGETNNHNFNQHAHGGGGEPLN